jgi:hypothetical protein
VQINVFNLSVQIYKEKYMEKDAVLNWLLGRDNPPVRLLTLTRLLHHSERESIVKDAKSHLMDYKVTQDILTHSDKFWQSGPRSFWSYKGKNWQTVYLGHFLANGHDPRIAIGVQGLLSKRVWVNPNCFQCMTACLLTAFRRLGYGNHPIVVEETESLAQRFLDDGGIACRVMKTSLLSHCYMALPKMLICFGEVPIEHHSQTIQEAISWITQELLDHQVYIYVPGNRKTWQDMRTRIRKETEFPEGESRKTWISKCEERFLLEHGVGERDPKLGWTRFGFPLNYNSDILEAMVGLATVGIPMNKVLENPLKVIRDKRTTRGVWLLEKSLNGKMLVDVEVKGQPSKWITFFALLVLEHFGQCARAISLKNKFM